MLSFLRKRVKVIIVAVAVVFVASVFYGLGVSRFSQEGKRDKNIATVNGRPIDPVRFSQILGRMTRSLPRNLSPQEMMYFQSLALDQTIDFTLLLNEAKKQVKVSGQEVDQAINSIMKSSNIPGKKELEMALKQNGMDMNSFRGVIKDEISIQKLVTKIKSRAQVTPDDLREIRVSHILIQVALPAVSKEAEREKLAKQADAKAQQKAAAVLALAKKGDNFAALAQKYSEDVSTTKKGGDLGYFSKGMMVKEFEDAAYSLKVGEISGLVKTPYGYHILKLEDSRLRKFKGETKDIETAALNEKQEREFYRWFSDIKSKAKIKINDPLLQGYRYRLQGKINEAIALFMQAISENPTNPYLHLLLGDTYAAIGQPDLRLQEYLKAVELNPGDANLQIILAKLYEDMAKTSHRSQNLSLALAAYKKASIVAGDSKDIRQQLADSFLSLGDSNARAQELAEIRRIEKKEKFEAEANGKATSEAGSKR
ncbi:MAG: peptidylprolyl isomerase [Candidatus Margulisiibacteriota bacterium]